MLQIPHHYGYKRNSFTLTLLIEILLLVSMDALSIQMLEENFAHSGCRCVVLSNFHVDINFGSVEIQLHGAIA